MNEEHCDDPAYINGKPQRARQGQGEYRDLPAMLRRVFIARLADRFDLPQYRFQLVNLQYELHHVLNVDETLLFLQSITPQMTRFKIQCDVSHPEPHFRSAARQYVTTA